MCRYVVLVICHFLRHYLTSLRYATISCVRRTTWASSEHLEIRCSYWCSGLESWFVSSGTRATSRPMWVHTRCCRPSSAAATRSTRSPNKVCSKLITRYSLCLPVAVYSTNYDKIGQTTHSDDYDKMITIMTNLWKVT